MRWFIVDSAEWAANQFDVISRSVRQDVNGVLACMEVEKITLGRWCESSWELGGNPGTESFVRSHAWRSSRAQLAVDSLNVKMRKSLRIVCRGEITNCNATFESLGAKLTQRKNKLGATPTPLPDVFVILRLRTGSSVTKVHQRLARARLQSSCVIQFDRTESVGKLAQELWSVSLGVACTSWMGLVSASCWQKCCMHGVEL